MDDLRCGDCHEGDDERRVFHELSQFIHHKSIRMYYIRNKHQDAVAILDLLFTYDLAGVTN